MKTALITHPDCLDHINPVGHPEQVARLEVIAKALADFELNRMDAPLGSEAQITLCHPQAHIEQLKSSPVGPIEPDTHLSKGTFQAALRGVGGITKAVDLVIAGEAKNAFVACRPPGHHAETSTAMGFCLFGNVAIAARHALETHGLTRVAIIDFDVHHGNGTQDLVWHDDRIFFASTHEMPLFPGTGAASETGAFGNIMNVPLNAGDDGTQFRAALENQILPAVAAWQPEMIFISAGFDAHRDDPLAGLNWTEADFAWATQKICDLAEKHCAGRLVSTLEGGYNLQALARSVAAHVNVLQEHSK